ncbi:MAG: TIGR02996 domain-containing protein [Archangium sp.]
MTVAKIEAALARQPDKALDEALALWRRTFDPELGKFIEALGAQLSKPLEDLPVKKKERSAALAALAAKSPAADRTAVLSAFEGFAKEAPGALVWPSIEAWAEVELDPRVARMAMRLLDSKIQLTGKLWRRLVNCVERHADLAVVEEARAYEAKLKRLGGGWGFSSERFSNVLKKLTAARACTAPIPAPALAKLNASVGKAQTSSVPARSTEDEGQMLLAICAAPDDDTPRAVYADWLTEHQDPRGEFITLQLRRARKATTKKERDREEALLGDHRRAFLGIFETSVAMSGLKFERGFLSAARFTARVPNTPLTRLLRHAQFDEDFRHEAQFDALESAVGPSTKIGISLPTRAPKLRDWTIHVDRPETARTWLAKAKLTALTVKAVEDARAMTSLLFTLPACAELESLSLQQSGDPRKLTLENAPTSLSSIIFEFTTVSLELTRGPKGWTAKCDANWLSERTPLTPLLASELFKEVRKFEVRGPEALKGTFARLPCSTKFEVRR